MSLLPPVDAISDVFTIARGRISSTIPAVPVFSLRAPSVQQVPYAVLRQQDDVRKVLYQGLVGARTILSVIFVTQTAQEAWSYQRVVRDTLHEYETIENGRRYFFTWDRTIPLEYGDHFAAITLYTVVIL